MPKKAPGYTANLSMLLPRTQEPRSANSIKAERADCYPAPDRGRRRLKHALESVFAERPESAMKMKQKMRLILAERSMFLEMVAS